MANETYKRPTVAGWLAPVMLGPWITIFLFVTAYAFLGPEWRYVPRWGIWAIGMLSGTVIGAVYVALLALVDVLLLAVKIRTFPTGKRGWLTATLSPLVFMTSYLVLRPWAYWKGGPWTVVAILAVPLVVTAIGTRLLTGTKVPRS